MAPGPEVAAQTPTRPVNLAHVPGAQPLEQKISNRRCHAHPSAVSAQTRRAGQQTAGALDSSALPPPTASNPPISALTSGTARETGERALVVLGPAGGRGQGPGLDGLQADAPQAALVGRICKWWPDSASVSLTYFLPSRPEEGSSAAMKP